MKLLHPEATVTMPHASPATQPATIRTGLVIDDVRISIGERVLLDAVRLGVSAGEFAAVLGPSGSGKTSLLNAICGLATIAKGTITLEERRVDDLSSKQRTTWRLSRIGRIDQHGDLLPELNAFDNVALPLRLLGADRRTLVKDVQAALDTLGIGDLGKRSITTMAGGEAHRVAIARAIVTRPALIVADEPTGALDETTSAAVISELRNAAQQTAAALVVVSHDPTVRKAADAVYRVAHHRLVAE
jgi:putative ABC transport system ATP-binding protein